MTRSLSRLLRVHWPIILPFLLTGLVFRAWLSPGLIIGHDFQRLPPDVLSTAFPWPHVWDASYDLGLRQSIWAPSYPLWALAGLLARLGAGWPLIERVCWLFPYLILSVLGPYLLVYRLTRVPYAAAVAASLFSLNTWIVGISQRGHQPSMVAFAFLPLIFLMFVGFMRRPTARAGLGMAAVMTLQIMYDFRYTYIVFLIMILTAAVQLVYDRGFGRLMQALPSVAVFVGGLIAFNLYWLAPQFLLPTLITPGYFSLEGFIGMAATYESPIHSLALFYPYYHYYMASDPFYPWPAEPGFFIIPALVFAALAFTWRSRYAPLIALLAISAVLIAGGPASKPLGYVDRFLFLYLPGFKLFRDVSKFNAMIALAYSLAIGLGMARLVALLRYRIGRSAATLGSLIAIGAVVAYAGLMHDAFNQIRRSNFERTVISPADVQLQNFLDAQPGFYRAIVAPAFNGMLQSTDLHPLCNAGAFAMMYPPLGFADLNSHQGDLLQFYASPLVPALLRELDVRYIIVIDDATGLLYNPYNFQVQYQETVHFFEHLPWLGKKARFGGNVVFEVLGGLAPRAFTAPAPMVFDGTAPALEALVGTRLWRERPAVVMAEQIDDPSALAWMPNIIQASALFDPKGRSYELPIPDLLHRLDTFRWMNRIPAAYHGAAFSRTSMTKNLQDWRNYSFFKQTFFTQQTSPAALHLVISRKEQPGANIISKTFRSTSDVAFRSPTNVDSIYSAGHADVEIDTPGAGISGTDTPGLGPGTWMAMAGTSGTLSITNPTPLFQTADISFPAVVSSGQSLRILRLTLHDRSASYIIPGRFEGWLLGGGVPIALKNVTLYPGINTLTMSIGGAEEESASAGGAKQAPQSAGVTAPSIFFRDDVAVANVREILHPVQTVGMALSLTRRLDGVAVDGLATAGPDTQQTGIIELLGNLDLPIDVHPTLQLQYVAPASPISLELIVGLRRYRDGSRFEYFESLPLGGLGQEDLFDSIQSALDSMWGEAIARHLQNPVWLRAHFVGGAGAASDYGVTYVRLAIVKALDLDASGAKEGHYVTVLRQLSARMGQPLDCGVRSTTCAISTMPRPEQHATSVTFSSSMLRGNTRAVGLQLLRTEVGPRQVEWQIREAQSPQAVTPSDISTGDSVRIFLTDGSRIEGLVLKAGPDTLTIQVGSMTVGVERRAITRIEGVYRFVVQRLKVAIPVAAASNAEYLAFDANVPKPYDVKLLLGFSKPGGVGGEAIVFPGKRRNPNATEDEVPKEWISPAYAPESTNAVPLSTPLELATPYPEEASWQHFQLDLRDIRAYRLPNDPRAEVRHLYISFGPPPGTGTSEFNLLQIRLANLALLSAKNAQTNFRTIIGMPAVIVDGSSIPIARVHEAPEIGRLLADTKSFGLPRGNHVMISTQLSPFEVDAALLSQGQPATFKDAAVEDFREHAPDVYSARLRSGDGLLVLPIAYSPYWKVALMPPDAPKPSGSALLDALRFGSHFLPEQDHVPVNYVLNGWHTPGGNFGVVFLFYPQVVNELAALAWLLACAAIVIWTARRTR